MRIIGTDFQRNGVGGEPFYAVWFEDEDTPGTLLAIIPGPVADDKEHGWQRCYVVSPNTPGEHWRGDVLYSRLSAAGMWERIEADAQARHSALAQAAEPRDDEQ